jgi:hypothetical protein
MLSSPNFFRLEIAYSELEVYQTMLEPPFDVRKGTATFRTGRAWDTSCARTTWRGAIAY